MSRIAKLEALLARVQSRRDEPRGAGSSAALSPAPEPEVAPAPPAAAVASAPAAAAPNPAPAAAPVRDPAPEPTVSSPGELVTDAELEVVEEAEVGSASGVVQALQAVDADQIEAANAAESVDDSELEVTSVAHPSPEPQAATPAASGPAVVRAAPPSPAGSITNFVGAEPSVEVTFGQLVSNAIALTTR